MLDKTWLWLQTNFRTVRDDTVLAAILLTTIIMAFKDKTATTSVLAGLFVVTTLLMNIDRLKSLSAFGVAAETREIVREAQATLAQVRNLAVIAAKQNLHQCAIQGRFVLKEWSKKNEMIREMNTNLIELGVDISSIEISREEVFVYAAADIVMRFSSIYNQVLFQKGVTTNDMPKFDKLASHLTIPDIMATVHSDERLSKKERSAMQDLADEYSSIIPESRKTGSLTDKGVDILDKSDIRDPVRVILGYDPFKSATPDMTQSG